MRKRFLAMGVLALCLMTSQFAHADEKRDAQIKAQMVENYLLWQEAYKNKDAERIISFESPDFTNEFFGEVHSKNETDKHWREVMQRIQKVNYASIDIKKVTVELNRVIVLSKHHFDLEIKSIDNNEILFVRGAARSRDIWVQYDGIWVLKRTEDFNPQTVINEEAF